MVMAPLWLALALAARADAPAAGPVTVEIVTVGHAETPADRYEIDALISVNAADDAAAQALLKTRETDLLGRIRQTGAQATIVPGSAMELFATNPAVAMALMPGNVGSKTTGKASTSAIVTITAPNRTAIEQAKASIVAIDGIQLAGDATTSVTDTAAARRRATDDGLGKARADAAAYADRLGLSKVTLVAISEKIDMAAMFMPINGKLPALGPLQKSTSDVVSTDVPLTITFRLEK